MAKKRNWLLIVGLSLLACSCLCLGGGGGGLYVAFWLYPRWANERIEVKQSQEGALTVHRLTLGGTAQGLQARKVAPAEFPGRDPSRLATTYSHRLGPIGRAMERFNWFPGPEHTYWADARLPAALVGLGAAFDGPRAQLVGVWSEPPLGKVFLADGAIASYARPYQWVDVYERNPAIIALSAPTDGKPPTFTFVQDAKARGALVRILPGDERATLDREAPEQFYQALIVDTIRGDPGLVSQELLTREAVAGYFRALAEDGIVCVHVSNRYYTLTPVLADAAAALNLAGVEARDTGPREDHSPLSPYSSHWVFLARTAQHLARLRQPIGNLRRERIEWRPLAGNGQHLWTDGGSNILRSLKH